MAFLPFVSDFQLLKLLGITNLVFLFLVFFSCRCIIGKKVFEFLWKNPGYQQFFKLHCYFWWGFFLSVLLHTLLALQLFPA